jgi:hypothetical protein
MLDILLTRACLRFAPTLLPGAALHRRALAAAAAGNVAEAEELFEAAAARYRRETVVEPLARLRVHQRMVRARAAGDPSSEAAMMLEIVRGLNRLDRLESLQSPHELRDARIVLAEWLAANPEAAALAPPHAPARPERARPAAEALAAA